MNSTSGIVILAIGLLLCFYGIRSLNLSVLAAGFGFGWILADLFGASALLLIVFGVVGAVGAWAVTRFVFASAAYFVGGVAGAVGGARLADVVQPGSNNWAVTAIVIVAVTLAAALAAERFGARALLWLSAIGGASMILSGFGRIVSPLDFLRSPTNGWQEVIAAAAWIVVAAAGVIVQRQLFADKIGGPSHARTT